MHNPPDDPPNWRLYKVLESFSWVQDIMALEVGSWIELVGRKYICSYKSTVHQADIAEMDTFGGVGYAAIRVHPREMEINLLYASRTKEQKQKGIRLIFVENEDKTWRSYRIYGID